VESALHWLSYSHTDQALLRDPALDGTWDALVVPGTLAAFYFEGTGGFVLARGRPYVIDPRTPLLQTIEVSRPEPKKSHLALAEIHDPDVPGLWPQSEIPLTHWQDGRWASVVHRVIDFQERYSISATAKIDKYAKLLAEATGRQLQVNPDPPHRIVPPYWAVTGADDPWWDLSREAIEIALDRCGPTRVMPIIAAQREMPIAGFEDLLGGLPDDTEAAFCWRGSWDEAEATPSDIRGWASVAQTGHLYGVEVTNLYGGFLSVLLGATGLDGLNHGVGYSEQRDVRRLGATGAPPTRYYVPALRNFVSRASAQPVLDALPREWACDCPSCDRVKDRGVPVVDAMSVEDLKRHFLICRHREILRVNEDIARELDSVEEVAGWIQERTLPGVIPAGIGARLALWADSVRSLL
jgi:hypothetical protein